MSQKSGIPTAMRLHELHTAIARLIEEEKASNRVSYNKTLPYQRYDRIGLEGLRWTPEKRIREYGIDAYAFPGAAVLDIGCNSGFVGIELAYAYGVGTVHGIEPNPWLCKIGQQVANFLEVAAKCTFYDTMFADFQNLRPYDVVLSLAAFHTNDGREREEAESYFRRCLDILKPGGAIFYESVAYNVEEKKGTEYVKAKEAMRVMAEYFQPERAWTMPSGSPGWCRDYFAGTRLLR